MQSAKAVSAYFESRHNYTAFLAYAEQYMCMQFVISLLAIFMGPTEELGTLADMGNCL